MTAPNQDRSMHGHHNRLHFYVITMLFSWRPCRQGWGWPWLPLSFYSSFFPNFSLAMFSINSLQLILSFAVVLHSPPTLSRSLLAQSSHRILHLPRLLSPPLSGHLISSPLFHLPFFPYYWPVSTYSISSKHFQIIGLILRTYNENCQFI